MKTWFITIWFLIVGLSLPLWAQKQLPIQNFHYVDSAFYRSAQPSKLDFSILEKREIYEVLNLRRLWRDNRKVRPASNLNLKWLPLNTRRVSTEDLTEALQIILARKSDLLVHCWHGSDRTGAVVGAYRVVVQGWDKEKAIHEMVDGCFGFHRIFGNLPRLIRHLDVAQMRGTLGLSVLPAN